MQGNMKRTIALTVLATVLMLAGCKSLKIGEPRATAVPTEKPTELWRSMVDKYAHLRKYEQLIGTDSMVYMVSDVLKGVDLQTRKAKWTYLHASGAMIESVASLYDGCLLFDFHRNPMTFDTRTRKPRFYDSCYPLRHAPVAGYGMMYFEQDGEDSYADDYLRCIDFKTGKAQWQVLASASHRPVVGDSLVVDVIYKKKMVAKTQEEMEEEMREVGHPVDPEREVKEPFLAGLHPLDGHTIFMRGVDSGYYSQYAVGEGAIVSLALQTVDLGKRKRAKKGYAFCLDRQGKEKWNFRFSQSEKAVSQQAAIINNGRVYLFFDKTYALDLQSGRLLWKSDVVPTWRGAMAAAVSNAVLVLNHGKITALSAKTGQVMWELEPKDDGQKRHQVLLCPQIIDGKLYVLAGRYLIAYGKAEQKK